VTGTHSGSGKRIIIIGIGGINGFLHTKCFLGGKSKKIPDYHSEMNSRHFEEWFAEVVKKIPDKSCIVMDQASYHRRITDDTRNPTTQWRKQNIIDWLVDKQIPVPEDFDNFGRMTIPLLLTLAREHKIKPVFQIERIISQSGKDVKLIWLPVGHCELNAIELIWANLKGTVVVGANNLMVK